MTTAIVVGEKFKHRVFEKEGQKQRSNDVLHVYIEGDGRPWRNRHAVSLDPSPKNPVMLQLMAVDPAPSIYLGRPCYLRVADANCSPQWWTDKRYSRAVVVSLNEVIEQYAKDYNGIMLFGHSGGGTLVMLLAEMRPDVSVLVTLAGNLDIDAWARHHRYSYLQGSMNPAEQPVLNAMIRQRHYLGTNDQNITQSMVRPIIARQHAAKFFLLENVDHSCCWQPLWPELLQKLRDEAQSK